MKILYLVRHAEAEDGITAGSDLGRRLTGHGKNQVEEAGEILKMSNDIPELIYTSPALRALETAHIFAEKLHNNQHKIRPDRGIYQTECGYLMDFVNLMGNEYSSVMIVGHDPSISNLAVLLTQHFNHSLSNSSVLKIQFDVDNWEEISEKSGELLFFKYSGVMI